jgi:small subunit ribosomal protein S6
MPRRKSEQSLYEVVFITRPDVATDRVSSLTERYSKLVTDAKGKVIKTEQWGLRTLAYTMNKHRKGYYTLLGCQMPGSVVTEMERQMKLSDDVIRFMTVKVEEISDKPSPVSRNDYEGDDDRQAA